jgi:hypothetical protein
MALRFIEYHCSTGGSIWSGVAGDYLACSGQVSGIRIPLQSLQVGPDIGSMLITQLAIFLQALVDDVLQFMG